MMTPWAWLSYTIRPFDMLADRRRWFWQRRREVFRFLALIAAINRLATAIEASNAKPAPRPSSGYRCMECGELADYRGDHLPSCSVYVAPWAGTVPADASGITDVTP